MKMNKILVLGICVVMMVSSCTTSTGSSAVNGAFLGGWFGSAVGGIVGGRYGHDVGTVIGMTTGVVAGAAVAQAEENSRKQEVREHYRRTHGNNDSYSYGKGSASSRQYDNSGFDSNNSGDDRLYDFQSSDYTGSFSSSKATSSVPTPSQIDDISRYDLRYSDALEISNARFIDTGSDGVLKRGEKAKIIFEIKNVSDKVLYDLVPTVVETTHNKHIAVSPGLHIESIAPGQRLRYTAIVVADRYVGNGAVAFSASVVQGGKTISKVAEFNIRTAKK